MEQLVKGPNSWSPYEHPAVASEDARDLERENAALRLQVNALQSEINRWTKWREEQPWVAEIQSYQDQITKMIRDAKGNI